MPLVDNVGDDHQPVPVEAIPNESVDLAEKESSPSKTGDDSGNNSFENMESLLVNEEDDEDPIIGSESLRLSGSEGEDEERISPIKRKKRAPKILDSDDEEQAERLPIKEDLANDQENENFKKSQDEQPKEMVSKPKKISALIDSDSEADLDMEHLNTVAKLSKLLDSESEQDEDDSKKKKKKLKESRDMGRKNKSKRSKTAQTIEKSQQKSQVSDLIDSDSESSNTGDDEIAETHNNEEMEGETPSSIPKKKQRASAKKAIDEIQAIQSETQRLYRETHVSIPYHKPKRRTVDEFLSRRTIVKPQTNASLGRKIKMTRQELEEYAKQLEERAKEATEFFKSESEDELENNIESDGENEKPLETNEVSNEVPVVCAEEDAIVDDLSETLEANGVKDVEMTLETDRPSSLTTQELTEIDMPTLEVTPSENMQSEPPSTSKESIVASKLSDLKRRLIAEKNLSPAPKIAGDPDMLIDLDSGDIIPRKPTGLDMLFERFVKSNAHFKKKQKEDSLLTNGNALDTFKLNLSVIEEPNKEKEPKPGAAYIKLKESLRSLITKKRVEDFQKKVEETREEEDEYKKCCGIDDDEEDEELERTTKKKKEREIVIDEEENELELDDDDLEDDNAEDPCENPNEHEREEEPVEGEEAQDIASDGGEDDKAEDEDEGDNDDEDDSESEEEPINEDPTARKHRVIKAFEDSDDEKDAGLNTTSTSELFAAEERKNPEEVENELLGLCSGQFEDTQRAQTISQIPITQTPGVVDDTELMDLCSGVFNQTQKQQEPEKAPESVKKNAMKIVSSDEEKEQENESASQVKKVKKLRKKQKKRAKLGFSDDEDDEEEPAEQDLADSYDEEEEEEEIPQTFIDYDSEENEIEVQMSKKECLKQANAFLEKEAELSESEWGSADEDEQNMDKYDIELGDEDNFDQKQIQEELEKIHMRKVLDDDIREVKKIQDMLFDNEEIDGVGRQRQFRWKNVESGFSLDDPAGGDDENNDHPDSGDDEEEMRWRKIRFEREQLLKQKTQEEILEEISKTTLGRNLLATIEAEKTNIVITENVIEAKEYKAPSFLYKQNDLSSMRGSFLNYDKETLARIAETVTKSGDLDEEQLQQKASKTGNFLFVPLTEEEHAARKRKSEEGKIGNVPKKVRPNSNKKSVFLDKLL